MKIQLNELNVETTVLLTKLDIFGWCKWLDDRDLSWRWPISGTICTNDDESFTDSNSKSTQSD